MIFTHLERIPFYKYYWDAVLRCSPRRSPTQRWDTETCTVRGKDDSGRHTSDATRTHGCANTGRKS